MPNMTENKRKALTPSPTGQDAVLDLSGLMISTSTTSSNKVIDNVRKRVPEIGHQALYAATFPAQDEEDRPLAVVTTRPQVAATLKKSRVTTSSILDRLASLETKSAADSSMLKGMEEKNAAQQREIAELQAEMRTVKVESTADRQEMDHWRKSNVKKHRDLVMVSGYEFLADAYEGKPEEFKTRNVDEKYHQLAERIWASFHQPSPTITRLQGTTQGAEILSENQLSLCLSVLNVRARHTLAHMERSPQLLLSSLFNLVWADYVAGSAKNAAEALLEEVMLVLKDKRRLEATLRWILDPAHDYPQVDAFQLLRYSTFYDLSTIRV